MVVKEQLEGNNVQFFQFRLSSLCGKWTEPLSWLVAFWAPFVVINFLTRAQSFRRISQEFGPFYRVAAYLMLAAIFGTIVLCFRLSRFRNTLIEVGIGNENLYARRTRGFQKIPWQDVASVTVGRFFHSHYMKVIRINLSKAYAETPHLYIYWNPSFPRQNRRAAVLVKKLQQRVPVRRIRFS